MRPGTTPPVKKKTETKPIVVEPPKRLVKRFDAALSSLKKRVNELETETEPRLKKTTKKTAKKKNEAVVAPRQTAKEIFEIKPTKSFDIKPWQQGVAIGDQDMPSVGIPYPSLCWEMFTGHTEG